MYFICMHVIVFSFIPSGLLKILREERQGHPNNRQNSSPFSLCCCIIIGIELDNFILYFSSPPETLSNHLTGHLALPRASRGSAIHTFLVKFQCTFHLLKQVRYIIITITVVVCNRQHFLVAIAIIILINKIINYHNQWISASHLSSPRPIPLLMTLPRQLVPTFF